jgi:hypothetical protein
VKIARWERRAIRERIAALPQSFAKMDLRLELGAYGVLARYPSGSVAAVERSFAGAHELAAKTLRRFERGGSFVDSLPLHPGALHDDYADVCIVRLRVPRGDLELALVRFYEDHDAAVPLSEPHALAIRGARVLRAAMLLDGRRLAWQIATTLRERMDEKMTFDTYSVQDRRPAGGLVMRAEARIVTAGQAVDAWMRSQAVDFDAELERIAAAS